MNGKKTRAWKITKDLISNGAMLTSNHTGTWGNDKGCAVYKDGRCASSNHEGLKECPLPDSELTVPFRLKDDDGEVYYEGRMSHALADSHNILAPLDDFATPNDGATSMEIQLRGEIWTPV